MRPEDPAISVQLVGDDVLELREELRPLRVARQDAEVQHVRVGEDSLAAFTGFFALGIGRVAVVGEDPVGNLECFPHQAQSSQLVMGQRLRRVQKERGPALEHRLQHWNLEHQTFPRGRRGREHNVVALL